MLESSSIARHKGEPGPASFEALRSDGIARVQDLASSVWTDYNVHDPGVTILEQVCYALTDLVYRAGFPVADLLVDEKGRIDWKRQSLLPPEDAFPSRAATPIDYRASILDAVPELENIRIDALPRTPSSPGGLYSIRLRLKPETSGGSKSRSRSHETGKRESEAIEKVRVEFSKSRNLGEDLDSVRTFPSVDYKLNADVEIKEGFDPADVLARIYLDCETRLAAGMRFESLDRAKASGLEPEEIFSGPFLKTGMIGADRGRPIRRFSSSDVFSMISKLPGVETVKAFPGEIYGAEESSVCGSLSEHTTEEPLLQLNWPADERLIGVRILSHGRQIRVSLHDLNMRSHELTFATRGLSFDKERVSTLFPRPQGTVRPIAEYLSVQHHFPPIYGVGPRVVPESASLRIKARARQLRGYLLLFDQPMADFLATLANLRHLFSIGAGSSDPESEHRPTYFFQNLNETSFPGIEDIYSRYAPSSLGKLLGAYPSAGRSKRLLDYLLALYGESFREDPFKAAAPEVKAGASPENGMHSVPVDPAAVDAAIIEAKIAYLHEIEQITRGRGAGADYSLKPDHGENRSGLEAKLSHLLGFERQYQEGGPGLRVMEHILLRPLASPLSRKPHSEWHSFRISVLIPEWIRPAEETGAGKTDLRKFDRQMVDSVCPAHLYADIYWVRAADEMAEFEELHRDWWNSYREAHPARIVAVSGSAAAGADARSWRLMMFLARMAWRARKERTK